ncbi:MAG: hypothetical protein JWQ98_26 [Chlorobi bacterium]|nr:hypothetical protein [Chlorobiota bacterium]
MAACKTIIGRYCAAVVVIAACMIATGCRKDSEEGNRAHHDSSATAKPVATADGTHDHGLTTKLDVAPESGAIPFGVPTLLTLTITDAKTGRPIEQFDSAHTVLMHLILVSTDLTWFNHIHPEYKGNGVFTVTATFPRAGYYALYADYTPHGRSQEVPQYEIEAMGVGKPAKRLVLKPAPDTVGAEGWMLKSVLSAPEGMPGSPGGSRYTVAMMPMPEKLTAGKDVMLHFQVRDAKGKPITDLEPYLGAMGHAVILSSDTKLYLHAHPMESGMSHDAMKPGAPMDSGTEADRGPNVIFHTNVPSPGYYKIWGQFQHHGKIITAPFVVHVE